MAVERICECIVRDEHSVLTVSSLSNGHYGIDDICLGLPAVVGKDGVEKLLKLGEVRCTNRFRSRNIINHVKEQSEKTVRLSSLVAETIAEEQVLVKDAQHKFDDLSEGVEASVVAISSIHEKTAALNGATERIVSVVSDLSALSEENAASSEEMNASVEDITEGVEEIKRNSDEMRGMSLQLKESVAYFKLSEAERLKAENRSPVSTVERRILKLYGTEYGMRKST